MANLLIPLHTVVSLQVRQGVGVVFALHPERLQRLSAAAPLTCANFAGNRVRGGHPAL
jgi:hypothetical protein